MRINIILINLITLFLVLILLFNPVVYNTIHVNDTTFMLQVSSWVERGATPGVDFNHFYGGANEIFVALGLKVSGGTVKALDFAKIFQFCLIVISFLLFVRGRVDILIGSLFILLCGIILFTVSPLEERPFILSNGISSAHSFSYNRFGTVLSLLCAVFLIFSSNIRWAEWVSGSIAGFIAILIVLTKVTFFPVLLAMIFSLIIMSRWRALVGFLLAFAFLLFTIDPEGQRTIGTLLYSMESTETGATESWLINKAIRLIFSQHVEVLAFLIYLVLLLVFPARARTAPKVLGIVLFVGAFWMSSVTMGPAGLVGHQAVPLLAGITLLLLPDLGSERARGAGLVLAGLLYISFVGPHLLNFAGATYVSLRDREDVALQSGPLSGYLVRGIWRTYQNGDAISIRHDPNRAVAATAERLASGRDGDATTDYVLLTNAVALLGEIEIPEGYGVVSNTQLGIGFAVGAGRADGFPSWPRASSPEFIEGLNPLRGASVVLLQRQQRGALTATLLSFLNNESFTLCRQSSLWDMYMRTTHSAGACQ